LRIDGRRGVFKGQLIKAQRRPNNLEEKRRDRRSGDRIQGEHLKSAFEIEDTFLLAKGVLRKRRGGTDSRGHGGT